MMYRFALCLAAVFLLVGCFNPATHAGGPNDAMPVKQHYSGLMGFTPWPSDLTEAALNQTYEFIARNGNIISHHLDNGVPWPEAKNNRPFPAHLKNDWQKRIDMTPAGHKILLSITPLDFGRKGLAKYWGETGDGQDLPKDWQDKAFNDPDVKAAFLNYARRAIRAFNPDFLAIGIESNVLISHHPEKWDAYLDLNAHVYTHLKAEFPSLPVFATVQYEHMRGIEDDSKPNQSLQIPGVRRLMAHSDYMALSTYRYGMLHPNPPVKDYFKQALSFGRPVAIAETGAMSETTLVMGIPLISNEKTQLEFIRMVLNNAAVHDFPFVINWVPRDFDPMLKKLPAEVRGIAKAWVHSGLADEKGNGKKAFKVWKSHLKHTKLAAQTR